MKVDVQLKKEVFAYVTVDVDDVLRGDPEAIKEAAFEAAHEIMDEHEICANCSGWSEKWSVEEDEEWGDHKAEVKDKNES